MEYSEKIFSSFKDECADLLNSLEEKLGALEKNPENPGLVNEIFRIIHSLKSESSLIGFTNFSTLSHTFENLFQRIRNKEMRISDDVIDVFYQVMDEYKVLFQLILRESHDRKNIDGVLKLLSRYIQKPVQETSLPLPEPSAIKLSEKEIAQFRQKNYNNIFLIKIKLFDNVALKYARAYLIYSNLLSIGEVVRSTVNFDREEENKRYGIFFLVSLTNKKEKEVFDLIDVSEVERIVIQNVLKEKEEQGIPEAGEVSTSSIRVNLDKIEGLMSMVGELTVNYNRMEKFYELLSSRNFIFQKDEKNSFLDILSGFKRLVTGLQDDVMKVRMVPLKTIFSKFPRLIKTLSRDLKKQVNLTITGEDTEVDKTVIEEIRDPLTHIIRNAIDHGIEHPSERIRKGKNPEGTVKISAYQSGNNIIIEITDDGCGIDHEKVKKQIIENRILTREKVDTLSPRQILSFIFLPGISTSDSVTQLSGRGVGMDVVKNNLKKINGTIQVRTEKEKGTSMIISLPITVAIIHSLIISSGNVLFAVPLYFIQETLRISENEIRVVDRYEVITLRKKILSLLKLNDMFSLISPVLEDSYRNRLTFVRHKKERKKLFLIVVNFGNKKIGLVVDRLISEQDIVIKPLSEHIKSSKGLIGATILGDGNIAYILDPVKLIGSYLKKK